MRSLSQEEFKNSVDQSLEEVTQEGEPLRVSRSEGKDVVVLPINDYNALRATLQEFASPQNIERLDKAIAKLESGDSAED